MIDLINRIHHGTKHSVLYAIVFFLLTGSCHFLSAQISPEIQAKRDFWEDFLKTAKIVDQKQMSGREAVTSPWKLTLEKDGTRHYGLWKNPEGRQKGYLEGWKWEIAAYRLDKLLDSNGVPPTVERRFRGNRGSLQLWIDAEMSAKDKFEKKIPVPYEKLDQWNKMLYIKYTFDNLIANEDRHSGNMLIDSEWRCVAIDHSRSFRISKKFVEKLIYTKNHKAGPMVMKQIPRSLYDQIEKLDFQNIREAVEEYLNDKEINAVLIRRDLILQEINSRIQMLGEDAVLY